MRRPTLAQQKELDAFLASVERRAFRMAEIATGNTDDALDILQDAMYKLVEKYADRPAVEWGPLFTTILQSRIKDWYRQHQVRRRLFGWLLKQDDDQSDPILDARDAMARSPEQLLQTERAMSELDRALHALPLRQQQVFLLRNWEGLGVNETAQAMSVSPGSVKTHYSRAIHSLRETLGEHWSNDTA